MNFELDTVDPLTHNQRSAFEAWKHGKHLLLTGTAGTGKSFLSIYLGMKEIMDCEEYSRVVIVRSVVPTRDMGFLPGNAREKVKVYEAPYYSIFSELFSRGDAYEYLKGKRVVEFMSTSFVRGITINDAIVIIDEIQNMTASELHSTFTRIGKNCRVIIAGDVKQTDLDKRREMSGFADFVRVLRAMGTFHSVEFNKNDVCRSDIVRDYIITRESMEEKNLISPL